MRRWLWVVVLIAVAACGTAPPNRRSQVAELTGQIRALPGVTSTHYAFGDGGAKGPAFLQVDVDVVDDIAANQLAAITSRYLDGLTTVDYTGYRAELDVHRAGDLFLVDSGGRPVSNRDQILSQAHSWVALRHRFVGSTVKLRATISHTGDGEPAKTVPNGGSIELPDAADYAAVAAAVDTLATSFGDLSAGDWTVSAGKQHPAEIRTSRRLPTRQEMELWNTLNTDQAIPHADVFAINNAVTGPFWVSEKIAADDLDTAVRLAQRHLPVVARLPAPTLYTASNQYRGHIGYYGQATGAVTIAIGGCIRRTYRPSPAEQALIDTYGKCPRPGMSRLREDQTGPPR